MIKLKEKLIFDSLFYKFNFNKSILFKEIGYKRKNEYLFLIFLCLTDIDQNKIKYNFKKNNEDLIFELYISKNESYELTINENEKKSCKSFYFVVVNKKIQVENVFELTDIP